LGRWWSLIQEFDLLVVWRRAIEHYLADGLSRNSQGAETIESEDETFKEALDICSVFCKVSGGGEEMGIIN